MTDLLLKEALEDTSRAVEKFLDRMLEVPEGPEAQVFEAMRYAVFNGGKRLRPLIVIAGCRLFGIEKTQSVRVAAALECVHCYSLIHDDLPAMDDDDMRRGKPSTHKQFDEATAILAGDALLTMAFEILADEDTHPDPYVRTELVKSLAKCAGCHGMVGGQMIDMLADTLDLREQEIFRLQYMKTGAIISFAAEAGAIMAHAGKHARASLAGYARDLGLAYQIADDLLDATADANVVGKATGKDAEAGKATLVGILGVERARQQGDILKQQAIDHLASFDTKAALLREIAEFVISRRS